MRKRKIITAIAGAFLGGAMMAAGLAQVLDGSGGNSAAATAATAPAASSTTLLASSGSSSSVSAADIYSAVRPSVVEIDVSAHVSAGRFGQQQQVQGTGSGVVIDKNGDILTNYHVIEGATSIDVVFDDGSSVSATVAGSDAAKDLAVIKVNPSARSLTPASLGDSSSVSIGESVLAIGNPFDLTGTLTEGIVSGLDRTPQDSGSTLSGLFQTDAAVNPGNSGGPLLNARGEVIGINTLLENPTGQNVNVGIAFAIPINTATQELSSLING